MKTKRFYKELIDKIIKEKPSKKKLNQMKLKLCKKYSIKKQPTDIQILLNANKSQTKKLKLITKPTRTISGVAVVAVMSYPFKCPHGKCTMCPGGPESNFGDVPQSYTGKEPATMRAIRNDYDPYFQVFNRLEHYVVMGQMPDKVELIVMGGTFPSYKKRYQEDFTKYCLKAMNDFSRLFFSKKGFDFVKFKEFFELPGDVKDETRAKNIRKKYEKLKTKTTLEKEQKKNESAAIRCVGLTLETRPDYAKLKHANQMLRLGCTRVELGVQSVYEKALKKIKRGHTVKDTIESIAILKDLGFKINAHYMPGLPGISYKEDKEGLKQLFDNSDFRPDMLKLYPCMVTKGTKLYKDYRKGKFKPLTTKKAAKLIADFKRTVPSYVRIMRVQRDIPTYQTEAGVDRTNLRQYIQKYMEEHDWECSCIRCREVGRNPPIGESEIDYIQYIASKGNEFFISSETENCILGFCRMRFPNKSLRKEIPEDSALIRELHVYGQAVQLGKKEKKSSQHKGIGKKLLAFAEHQARLYHKKKMVIISGIGVRAYYRKFGYKKQGPYMIKSL